MRYFPPHDKWGRPGFATICKRVLQVWKEQRNEIEAQADQTIATLQELSVGDAAISINIFLPFFSCFIFPSSFETMPIIIDDIRC